MKTIPARFGWTNVGEFTDIGCVLRVWLLAGVPMVLFFNDNADEARMDNPKRNIDPIARFFEQY